MEEGMSIEPTWSGEVQLAGWSESHNSGCKVTFWLADSDELEAFRALTVRKGNTAGHRLACVLVEIGDDEQPVQPQRQRRPDMRGPLCREACDYCGMEDFQRWVPRHTNDRTGDRYSEEACKRWILRVCGVESRKELDASDEAAGRFVRLIRLPFMKQRQAA
jgi:hypothetical protein